MDFRFTDEQDMTASVVRDLLSDLCQSADLRRLMASEEARDENRWSKIVEMGLAGALVEETAGGFGLKAADFVLAVEACGYACLPEPLVENAGVSLPLLAEAAPDNELLAQALAGEITVATGHPSNLFVCDADTAGALVIGNDDGLFLVERQKAELARQPSVDPFRRLFAVDFSPADATRLADPAHAASMLDAALDRGALFAAAQLVGIAQRCVDLAVAYAKDRHQFGKPIGSYQAVKHQLATAQVKIEFAKPILYAAAASLPEADMYSRARISHAKLVAAEAADLSARTAIQVHGAMGYSWEVDVHFFLKRAIALETWWGAPAFHRERVACRVLGGELGPEHTFAKEARDA
ncbi:acyl-CoA dehydrogenase family protein [Oricola sp.]|uniref:acyl-CoA dehydrogenase family protein n=1 Tax=Oricola sp. TaxID=1979950 RepID=UPI0025CD6762|nr:acyl-CoA dehydrogenase family protein [Oricola sp.]MCI5074453.1 acyl-CoA/acyl-ACP dehydrogenase [Oricola sp.]